MDVRKEMENSSYLGRIDTSKLEVKSVESESERNGMDNPANGTNVYYVTLAPDPKQSDQDVYLQNLGKFVASIFNESQYSDIDILLEDGHQISAHKVILASRSQDWGVEDLFTEEHLDLSYLKYEIGYTLIKWVYTNIIQLEKEDLISLTELLKISTKFKLNALTKCCEEAITVYIDQDNAKSYFHLASEFSASNLKDYCTNYLLKTEIKIEKDTKGNDIEHENNEDGETHNDDDDDDHNDTHDEVNNLNIDHNYNVNTHGTTVKPTTKKSVKDNLECFYCCAKVKAFEELEEHAKRHKSLENPYECTICGAKNIPSRRHLRNHIHAHNPKSKGKEKKCNVCDVVFNSALNLKIHKKINHPGPTPYKCKFCAKQYRKRWHLDVHVRLHTGERPYTCEICGKTFKDMGSLRMHGKSHSAQRPFMCDNCSAAFISIGPLNKHKKNCGQGPNSNQNKECQLCNVVFDTVPDLKSHKKAHHSSPGSYNCEYCGKPFKKRSKLQVHLRVHTGERPYTCELCGKSFKDSSTLGMHVRAHDPQRPFVCGTCGAAFISLGPLNRHAKNHDEAHRTKIMCNVCGHSFRSKNHLKTHLMTHTGEKPHKCTHCSRAFTDKSCLRRHIKIHTGEKPHKCDVCEKSFIQRIQLRKHQFTHEKILDPSESSIFIDDIVHNFYPEASTIEHNLNIEESNIEHNLNPEESNLKPNLNPDESNLEPNLNPDESNLEHNLNPDESNIEYNLNSGQSSIEYNLNSGQSNIEHNLNSGQSNIEHNLNPEQSNKQNLIDQIYEVFSLG